MSTMSFSCPKLPHLLYAVFLCCDMPLFERFVRENKGLLRVESGRNVWVGYVGNGNRCWRHGMERWCL